MRLSDFLTLSSRTLITKPSRTFLTILGMGVGIGAVLFLVSLGYGLRQVLIEEITTSKSFVTLDVTYGGTDLLQLNKENVDQIKEIENIHEVSPIKEMSFQVNFNNLTGEVGALSVRPSYFGLSDVETSWGRLYEDNELDKIVISETMAKLFDESADTAVGKRAIFSFFIPDEEEGVKKIESEFEVVGVVEGVGESIAFVHQDNFRDYNLGDYSMVKIEVTKSEFIDEVRQRVMDLGFSVSGVSDTIEQANTVFKAITVVLAFFGTIALIVSAIGMFNTMTITLLERIQEIGVMKSIGASNSDIAKLFITESTIMGFLGAVVGVAVGLTISELLNFGLNLLASNLGGERIDIFYSPSWFIILIVVFGMVIGFLTGIFPARRAGKIDALDALRYK
jgi:putative ABC transport system permease protein